MRGCRLRETDLLRSRVENRFIPDLAHYRLSELLTVASFSDHTHTALRVRGTLIKHCLSEQSLVSGPRTWNGALSP